MSEYIVLLKQAGEGCDYMIDCGKTYFFREFRKSDTLEKITQREWNIFHHGEEDFDWKNSEYSVDSECILEEMVICLNGEYYHIDVKEAYRLLEKDRQEFQLEKERKSDEAEFERLKAKLNR